MKKLELNNLYSREEVHSIFSPNTKFTPQAGTWGLHGVVEIPDRLNDHVFFVTYGQSQSGHDFDEGITDQGVLSWQSQPRQGLDNKKVKLWINHDEKINNIYLFLRKNKKDNYRYYGRLKYLSHDNSRENPVYFQWQIIDWRVDTVINVDTKKLILKESSLIPKRKEKGVNKKQFRGVKSPDYSGRDEKNKKIGDLGEELVLRYEQQRLIKEGRTDLSKKVEHTSKKIGDGTGYDIKSFNKDSSLRFIEVKATEGNINTEFYISPNEIDFSKIYSQNFYLYRVYNVKIKPEFYKFKGNILDNFEAIPTTYKLKVK